MGDLVRGGRAGGAVDKSLWSDEPYHHVKPDVGFKSEAAKVMISHIVAQLSAGVWTLEGGHASVIGQED